MRTTICSVLRRIPSKGVVLVPVALLATVALAPRASAQNGTCLQDEYNVVQKQKLNCTANDVRVAKVINIRNPDGSARFTCTGGNTFSFIADFLVQTTSSESRSNIGLYFGNSDISNQPDALTGSCTDNIIAPPHKASDTSVTACLGSGATADSTCTGYGTYEELDTGTKQTPGEPKSCNSGTGCTDQPTGCGDTTSSDGMICLTAPDPTTKEQSVVPCSSTQKKSCTAANNCFAGTQVVTVEIPSFTCPDLPAGSQVTVGDCTSWQIPGGVISCVASPEDYMYPTVPNTTPAQPEAIPGSPSKCNCEQITLPLIVQTPTVVVQKACTTTTTAGPATFNPTATPPTESPVTCDAGPEGSYQQVTYTVNIYNSSNTGGITVTQICDSEFGKIYRSPSSTDPACAAGSTFLGTGSVTCPSSGTLDVGAGSSVQCTFTSTPSTENLGVGANGALSDFATVYGVGDSSHTGTGAISSNTVDVDTEDAPSSARTTPSPTSTTNVCATERFTATVTNTSGADETIFISGLSSTSGDLTTASAAGPIVGTTCGVSTSANGGNGLGTLQNSPANPFPAAGIAPNNGTYTCYFDVNFCGTPSTVEAYGTGHCSGNAITPGTCTNGGAPAIGSCTTNDQCDATCTGISLPSETLNPTLSGDDAAAVAADVISPVINDTGNASVCVQPATSVN